MDKSKIRPIFEYEFRWCLRFFASTYNVIFRRPRSTSLGDTPKKLTKGEKKLDPPPTEERIPKKGKGSTSPSYAAATRGQTLQKDGEWQLVEKKKKKKKKNKKKERDAIRVLAKDGESYAEILKAMKAKVKLARAR